MAKGIETSDVFLVCVTQNYVKKCENRHDNCRREYTYAANQKKKFVYVVMETNMLDTKLWTGTFGIVVEDAKYIDCTSVVTEKKIDEIIQQVRQLRGEI